MEPEGTLTATVRPVYVGLAEAGKVAIFRGQIKWLAEGGNFTGFTEVELPPGEYHEVQYFHHPSEPPTMVARLDHPLRHHGGLKSIGPINFLGDLVIAEVRA